MVLTARKSLSERPVEGELEAPVGRPGLEAQSSGGVDVKFSMDNSGSHRETLRRSLAGWPGKMVRMMIEALQKLDLLALHCFVIRST